jgi:hypothetical protein
LHQNRKRQWTEVVFSFPQELQKLPKPVGNTKGFGPASPIALYSTSLYLYLFISFYPILFFTFPSYFPIFFYYFLGISVLVKSPLLLNFLFLLLAVFFFLQITFASFNEILFHLTLPLPLSTLLQLVKQAVFKSSTWLASKPKTALN